MLPFDLARTPAYTVMLAKVRPAGPTATANACIAAIAASNGMAVAARDTLPFEAAGAAVIDRWRA